LGNRSMLSVMFHVEHPDLRARVCLFHVEHPDLRARVCLFHVEHRGLRARACLFHVEHWVRECDPAGLCAPMR